MRHRSFYRVCRAGLLFAVLLASCHDSGASLVHSTACTETFTACGGDPSGTWEIVGMCIEGDIAAEYNEVGVPACKGGKESVSLAASGTVTYGVKFVTYQEKTQETTQLHYSWACADVTLDIATLNDKACAEIQRADTDASKGQVSVCDFDGTNCACSQTYTAEVKATNAFAVAGATIEEKDGTSYDFCVNGSTMVQRKNVYGHSYVVTTFTRR